MPVTQAEPTKRQEQLLAFMLKYQRKHGIAPTLRECGKALRMKSPAGPTCHIRALLKKGRIRAEKRGSVHRYVAIDPELGSAVRP